MWLSQPRAAAAGCWTPRRATGCPTTSTTARPILHEPGPMDTRYFLSRTGIPGRSRRDDPPYRRLRRAPASARHVDHARLCRAPAFRPRKCIPLPGRPPQLVKYRRVRTEPPQVTVPLNRLGTDGHTRIVETPLTGARRSADGETVDLRNSRFTPGHVSVPAGSSLTWRFRDAIPHNVILANGPRLVGSRTLSGGAQPRPASRSRALRAVLLPAPGVDAPGRRRAAARRSGSRAIGEQHESHRGRRPGLDRRRRSVVVRYGRDATSRSSSRSTNGPRVAEKSRVTWPMSLCTRTPPTTG